MRISKREVLVGVVFALILLGILWLSANQADAPALEQVATTTPVQTEAESESAPPSVVLVRETEEPTALKSAAVERGTATFTADGTRYELSAPEGSTLKEAMDRLQSESTFTYEYRNYTGLGAFVTHINGRAGTGELVWILYVNGEKSSTGISATRIRSGDVIEWKLEESY